MSASDGGIAFGPFLLDLARGELVRAGELVALAPKPLALLGYLAANRDRAVPKQELRKQVWPDVFVSEAALASALKDLRRALGDDGARQSVIRTLRRRGYRFVAKLDEPPSERARAAEARARATALELPKAPPFVARGRELRALTSAVVQAGRGRPRVVLISGEAGSGKTRLLEQLLAHPVCARVRDRGRALSRRRLAAVPAVRGSARRSPAGERGEHRARARRGRPHPAPAAPAGRPEPDSARPDGPGPSSARARGPVRGGVEAARALRAAARSAARDRGPPRRRRRVARAVHGPGRGRLGSARRREAAAS